MHADIREAQVRQAAIHRTAEMAADQTTTDAYAQIPESVLNTERHNRVRYVIEETGATNGIDARLVGRIKDDAGNWSAWQAVSGGSPTATNLNGASAALYPSEVVFDQYAVEIKANAGGSQGDVDMKGKSFFLDT